MQGRSLSGQSVVVTGGASGIGRATVLAAAARGARIFTCDLDAKGLAETVQRIRGPGSVELSTVVDVAKADEMRVFSEQVHAIVPAVDLLVNNAGVPLGARFQDTTLDDWRWIVDINFMGVVHGCHFFVPKMVEQARGAQIVNLASLAAFLPIEGSMAYCATKAAVLAFSEGLRVELAQHRIGVTAVCPGVINTPIVTAGRRRGFVDDAAVLKQMQAAFVKRNYRPELVAERILSTIDSNPAVLPVAAEAWTFYYLKRFAPGLTLQFSELAGRLMEKAAARVGAGR